MTNREYRLNVRLTQDDGERLEAMCIVSRKRKSDVVRDLIQDGYVNTAPDQRTVLCKQAQCWDHFNTACLKTQEKLDTIGQDVRRLCVVSQDKSNGVKNRIGDLCMRLDMVLDDIQEDFKRQCNDAEKEMSNYVRF